MELLQDGLVEAFAYPIGLRMAGLGVLDVVDGQVSCSAKNGTRSFGKSAAVIGVLVV